MTVAAICLPPATFGLPAFASFARSFAVSFAVRVSIAVRAFFVAAAVVGLASAAFDDALSTAPTQASSAPHTDLAHGPGAVAGTDSRVSALAVVAGTAAARVPQRTVAARIRAEWRRWQSDRLTAWHATRPTPGRHESAATGPV